ncbi:MAG: DUF4870 domain-containing protein [Phycisphaeraceae bacterium]|nr:DUF4870 domain-containing protein [Phycisphaeraceae bacterium]
MTYFDLLTLTRKERLIAGASHLFVVIPFLGFLAPIIIWTNNEDRSEYIAFQSLQALVYQVMTLVIWLIGIVLYDKLWNTKIWFVVLIINWIARFMLVVYGTTGAVMAFQGAAFRYWFIGDKIEYQLSTSSNRQWLANFWKIKKRPIFPILVGLGISLLHFAITPYLFSSSFASVKYISGLILSTPSLILSFVFEPVINNIFLQYFSSFVYGSIAGILVSRKIVLQVAVIILMFSMIIFGFFFLIMAGQAFA